MTTQPATDLPSAHNACHRSKARSVRHPGSFLAAKDLKCHPSHLHRVLTGERRSHRLLARWKEWLKQHPEFAKLNRKAHKA